MEVLPKTSVCWAMFVCLLGTSQATMIEECNSGWLTVQEGSKQPIICSDIADPLAVIWSIQASNGSYIFRESCNMTTCDYNGIYVSVVSANSTSLLTILEDQRKYGNMQVFCNDGNKTDYRCNILVESTRSYSDCKFYDDGSMITGHCYMERAYTSNVTAYSCQWIVVFTSDVTSLGWDIPSALVYTAYEESTLLYYKGICYFSYPRPASNVTVKLYGSTIRQEFLANDSNDFPPPPDQNTTSASLSVEYDAVNPLLLMCSGRPEPVQSYEWSGLDCAQGNHKQNICYASTSNLTSQQPLVTCTVTLAHTNYNGSRINGTFFLQLKYVNTTSPTSSAALLSTTPGVQTFTTQTTPIVSVSENTLDETTTASNHTLDKTTAAPDHTFDNTTTASDYTLDEITTASDHTLDKTTKASDHTLDETTRASAHTFDNTTTASDHTLDETITASDNTFEKTTTPSDHTLDQTTTASDHTLYETTTASDHTLDEINTASDHTFDKTTTASSHTFDKTTTASDHTFYETTTASDHTLDKPTTASDHTLDKTTTASDPTLYETTTESDHTLEKTTTASDHTLDNITKVSDHTLSETTTASDHTLNKTTTASDHTLDKTITVLNHTLDKTTAASDHTFDKTTTASDHTLDKNTTASDNTLDKTTTAASNTLDKTTTASDRTSDSGNHQSTNNDDKGYSMPWGSVGGGVGAVIIIIIVVVVIVICRRGAESGKPLEVNTDEEFEEHVNCVYEFGDQENNRTPAMPQHAAMNTTIPSYDENQLDDGEIDMGYTTVRLNPIAHAATGNVAGGMTHTNYTTPAMRHDVTLADTELTDDYDPNYSAVDVQSLKTFLATFGTSTDGDEYSVVDESAKGKSGAIFPPEVYAQVKPKTNPAGYVYDEEDDSTEQDGYNVLNLGVRAHNASFDDSEQNYSHIRM